MFFTICFPVTVSAVAVIMDLRTGKVDNGWILFCMTVEFVVRILTEGALGVLRFAAGTIFPIICLGLLFWFRMLGPGDIKLFAVLGGIMGTEKILRCLVVSFLFGACISIALLISCGNTFYRFRYFCEYMREYLETGKIHPYYQKDMAAPENFHFTIPVFMSVVLYAGGVY